MQQAIGVRLGGDPVSQQSASSNLGREVNASVTRKEQSSRMNASRIPISERAAGISSLWRAPVTEHAKPGVIRRQQVLSSGAQKGPAHSYGSGSGSTAMAATLSFLGRQRLVAQQPRAATANRTGSVASTAKTCAPSTNTRAPFHMQNRKT